MAQPGLRAGRAVGGGSDRWSTGGIVDGAYYKYAGRRSPENPDRFKVFAPRFGFAWRPMGEKTVFRGGYGVFFDSAEGREIDGAADVYPYVSRGNYIQSLGQPTPLQTSDALFPSFAAPGVATPAANTFLAVSQSPQPRNPYMQQWSLGGQRELAHGTTFELNYIGTHGTNLLMRRNIAQAFPYDPAHPLSVDARKPYPNFVVYIDSDWSGRSNYHALNTKLEHRGARFDPDLRLHMGKEHRLKICGRRHWRRQFQRLAGLPQQPRSRTGLWVVGLRRRSSAGRQLRLQPAVR